MDSEESLESFLLFLATERGLSTNYQLSVRQSLERYLSWVQRGKKDWQSISTDELNSYLGQLKPDGLSPSSIRIHQVHLKIFYRYAVQKSWLDRDPAAPLLPPKVSATLPDTINVKVLQNLFESIDTTTELGARGLSCFT